MNAGVFFIPGQGMAAGVFFIPGQGMAAGVFFTFVQVVTACAFFVCGQSKRNAGALSRRTFDVQLTVVETQDLDAERET